MSTEYGFTSEVLAALSLHAACAAEESEEVVHTGPLPLWRVRVIHKRTQEVVGTSPWMSRIRADVEAIKSTRLLGSELLFAVEQKVQ